MSRAPGSRANPRHAVPLTPPGNPAQALFHQPPALCGHPRHFTTLCGKAGSTRHTPFAYPKREYSVQSSSFSSTTSIFPHLSSPISHTPNQLPPVGPMFFLFLPLPVSPPSHSLSFSPPLTHESTTVDFTPAPGSGDRGLSAADLPTSASCTGESAIRGATPPLPCSVRCAAMGLEVEPAAAARRPLLRRCPDGGGGATRYHERRRKQDTTSAVARSVGSGAAREARRDSRIRLLLSLPWAERPRRKSQTRSLHPLRRRIERPQR
jgi:hypothetical protein